MQQSGAEKRKNLRRSISYPAFIDLGDGSPVLECTLCDASQLGAQLHVAEPDTVPDEFTLALSSDGAARRVCRVAWRAGKNIGVQFLKDNRKEQSLRPAARMMMELRQRSAEAGEGQTEEHEDVDKVDIDTLSPR